MPQITTSPPEDADEHTGQDWGLAVTMVC